MASSPDNASAPDERPAGPVTTRLRLLEGLLSAAPPPAETPPAPPVPRSLVTCERLVAALGVIGLLATIVLAGRSIAVVPTPIGWVGWTLLGLGAILLLAGTALAAGAGRWDALVMRWRRQPPATVGARDRLTTLIAAILLIVAATAELACFQALVDGRVAAASSQAMP